MSKIKTNKFAEKLCIASQSKTVTDVTEAANKCDFDLHVLLHVKATPVSVYLTPAGNNQFYLNGPLGRIRLYINLP